MDFMLKMSRFSGAPEGHVPITAVYPPGSEVRGMASRSLGGADIGRLAATIIAVPFATVQAQAPSRRDQRLYAFAYTVLKSVAAEMAVETETTRHGKRRPAGQIRVREVGTLISSTFQTYDAVELRNIQNALGIPPYRNASAISRAAVLMEVAVEVARRLVFQNSSAEAQSSVEKFAGGLLAAEI